MNGISKRSFISCPSLNAFRDQLFGVLSLLEIAVLGARFHGTNRTHAAINFILPSLEYFRFSGTFRYAGKHAAEHNSMCTGCKCLNNITGILDAAVSYNRNTIFGSCDGAIMNSGYLRNADTGHNPGCTN